MSNDLIQLQDAALLEGIDLALAMASARSGPWLACRPGCSQCCVGAFSINPLDARRLRSGLQALRQLDAARAARVEARAAAYVERVRDSFPGNADRGLLGESEEELARFEDFANDEVCPALDPDQKTCDLYQARPITCRVFGPPVRNEEGLGVCELCFVGAGAQQIAECEMVPDPDDLESEILNNGFSADERSQRTLVAYALHPSHVDLSFR